ncbi:hypothetical protein [Amycolatopsis nigrescens]|uniref:hypothetical protein n=1 Tax=Amycolatopsis nigrescens TaxID=381445 RepID=UPI0012FB1929|nr:hypothetical protein [Amycolatopsis nigrescens]
MLGHLLGACGLLAVFLLLHALPCGDAHAHAASPDSTVSDSPVSHQVPPDSGHPFDHHCEDGGLPHESAHPQCMTPPRTADGDGAAFAALLLLLSVIGPAGGLARYRPPVRRRTTGPPRRGRDVLCELCVLRR